VIHVIDSVLMPKWWVCELAASTENAQKIEAINSGGSSEYLLALSFF